MLKNTSVHVLLLTLLLPNVAFAQSIAASAYEILGCGLLVLLGLTAYVIRQLRYLLHKYSQQPAK